LDVNTFLEGVITIALAVIGLAMVSVLFSRNANTAGVLQAASSGFGNVIGVAAAPVSGASFAINLDYPSQSMFGA